MTETATPPRNGSASLPRPLILLGLGIGLAWSYYPTFGSLVQTWIRDPQASHGFVVPVVALLLLWVWRQSLPSPIGPVPAAEAWWGVAFLLAGAALRLVGAYYYLPACDGYSLLPSLAGICLLGGGWPTLRWAWVALVYLIFMLPLPFQVETALSGPLQRVATLTSTYALQTLGFPAVSEGNVIVMGDARIGVVEACNGLGMLMAFFATSSAMALVIQRPWLDRLVLFFSAIPIGIVVNVLRITATGVAHQTLSPELADKFFHDVAGWLMMPLALLALWLELLLLDRLLVPRGPAAGPVPLSPSHSQTSMKPVAAEPNPSPPPGPENEYRPTLLSPALEHGPATTKVVG